MNKYDFYWKFIERPKRILESKWCKFWGLDHNERLIRREVTKHRGEFAIDPSYNVVKLLGWVDGDDDYYYVVFPYGTGQGKVYLMSCVGGLMYLKGRLSTWDYLSLENSWELNHRFFKKDLEKQMAQIKKAYGKLR